jgi:uroporphyrinogen decarboxylase
MLVKSMSKQRVLNAINHEQPERTPCGYVGTPEVDQMLKNHFNTDSMDVVFEKLQIDLRYINVDYIGPELRKWPDGRFENFWGQIRKAVVNEAGTYFEAVEFPYKEFKTVKDVNNFHWPKVEWFDYDSIKRNCEKYADYGIVFGATQYMDLINGISMGRGLEQLMFDIALEDPVGMACLDKRFQCCYDIAERALEAGDGLIDIFWCGDDYGSQNGLLISPDSWRKIFFPKVKKMCELGHKYGAKVMVHSCGSTRIIWPDLIEAGVDIYDTVQPEAAGMEATGLKKDFGDKMCFHGTISTQQTLPFGTPEDVTAEVKARIETVGKDGGFIVAPAHNFQPDTPLENILALYEAVASS